MCEVRTSNESPDVLPTEQSEKGLTRGDRVLLSLTQQSASARFFRVTAAAGGLIKTTVGRGVSFVTQAIFGGKKKKKTPNAINTSGGNKQKIRDARSPNHQMSKFEVERK